MDQQSPKRGPLLVMVVTTALLLFACDTGRCQAADPDRSAADRQALDNEFDRFVDSLGSEFDTFVAQLEAEFQAFRRRVDRYWDDAKYPATKTYVEYDQNFQARTAIDFEQGQIEASILIPVDSTAEGLEVGRQRLHDQIVSSLETPGRQNVYSGDESPLRADAPLAEASVVDADGNVVVAASADSFARDLISRRSMDLDTITSGDGVRRIKLSVTYSMVPDQLRKRATRYLPIVTKYARQYDLDLRLVMAIIHTESYFNPVAISKVPAFGLMQIVPSSAGRDASRLLYGEERMMSPEFLYDPQNNISFGCAYLHVLRTRYMPGIVDDQLAYPCMIASYNGGIGVVCQSLTNTRGLNQLAEMVTAMSYDQLVSTLEARLPYKETRDYVSNVLSRMPLYDEWVR